MLEEQSSGTIHQTNFELSLQATKAEDAVHNLKQTIATGI